jgi:hypothetical protein
MAATLHLDNRFRFVRRSAAQCATFENLRQKYPQHQKMRAHQLQNKRVRTSEKFEYMH